MRCTSPAAMPSSDRAFRALAQTEPGVIVALLDALAPHLLPAGEVVHPEEVDDPRLALPPTMDADWIARAGESDVLHIECQGYRDASFADRLLRYHLSFVLRYHPRRVHTVALWLIAPPLRQRRGILHTGSVAVRVHSLVLPEIPAELLLASPRTACFAPGAAAGSMTSAQICRRAAASLRSSGASSNQLHMAVVAAAMRGRYNQMVEAMNEMSMEPVIIEDLVKIGEDIGFERGIQKGIEEGRIEIAREWLLSTLEARGIELDEHDRARILAEPSMDRLRAWHRRALTIRSAGEILSD
jgi:hypothetical protein